MSVAGKMAARRFKDSVRPVPRRCVPGGASWHWWVGRAGVGDQRRPPCVQLVQTATEVAQFGHDVVAAATAWQQADAAIAASLGGG